MVSHTPCTLKCDYTLYIYYGAAHHRSPVFFCPFFRTIALFVPLFVVLTCLIAVPDCLRVVVSSPSFLPESPSFPSLRFFLPLLPFFFFFAFFLPFSPFRPCFSLFFFIFLKKVLETFCGYLKSSYLCTRFPQGGLDQFFDRLRTHQSYSRLLAILLASAVRVDSFYIEIQTCDRAGQPGRTDNYPPFLFFW